MPCLTTRTPVAGDDDRGHRGDVDGVRAVAAGADDVEARPGHLDPVGVRQHHVGQARAAPRRVSPLARSATRNPATCDRGRLAAHDLVHRPARGLGASGPAPASSEVKQVRPASVPPAGGRRTRLRQPRTRRAATQLGHGRGQGDRVERVRHGQVGLRPGGEPAVLRATGEHEDRRAVEDLVLELAAQAQTARPGRPRRRGSAGRSAPASTASITAAAVAHSRQLDDLDVARRTASDGDADGVAGGDVVAVEQHRDAMAGAGARAPRGYRSWAMPAAGACEAVMAHDATGAAASRRTWSAPGRGVARCAAMRIWQ